MRNQHKYRSISRKTKNKVRQVHTHIPKNIHDLQRALDEDLPQRLTSDVVNDLQSTHGNQFVQQLVSKQQSTQTQQNSFVHRMVQHASQVKETTNLPSKTPTTHNIQRKIAVDKQGLPVNLGGAFDDALKSVIQNLKDSSARFAVQSEKLKGFDQVKGNAISFEEIWNSALRGDFKAFTEKEFSDENVLFFEATEKFKMAPTLQSFVEIYEKYLPSNADKMINIGGSQRKQLKKIYNAIVARLDYQENEMQAPDYPAPSPPVND